MMEDKVYSIQIAYYSKSYGCVDGPFYYYFQRDDSICGSKSEDSMMRCFKDASANMKLIEDFLKSKNILQELKPALNHSEYVVMGFLVPLLKRNNKYRSLWIKTFPNVTRTLWCSSHISLTMKVISLLIITGLYPFISKLQKK